MWSSNLIFAYTLPANKIHTYYVLKNVTLYLALSVCLLEYAFDYRGTQLYLCPHTRGGEGTVEINLN